jgi:hypothetical protein
MKTQDQEADVESARTVYRKEAPEKRHLVLTYWFILSAALFWWGPCNVLNQVRPKPAIYI